MNEIDNNLYDALTFAAFALGVAYVIWIVKALLTRSRPGLAIARPLAAAFLLRAVGAAALSLTSFGPSVRGGDEPGEILRVRIVADLPLTSNDSGYALTHDLYRWLYALPVRLAHDAPDLAIRMIPIGLGVLAVALFATAVYELAGARAGVIAAWVLAFEPTNVFFSSVVHKEATMLLADALVAVGGAYLWKRGRVLAVLPMVAGCLVALGTRPYAAWFLIGAAGLIALHAVLRLPNVRTFGLGATVVVLAILAAPTVWYGTTPARLKKLQTSQEFGSRDNSNLKLEPVDFSSRGSAIRDLPRRIRDVLLRPYPWQTANASQRLGFLGTVAALVVFLLVVGALIRNRGQIMERAGPLVYVTIALLIAYSLSASNAGTGFRYRTHVIALMLCMLVVLRVRQRERTAVARPGGERRGRSLALAR